MATVLPTHEVVAPQLVGYNLSLDVKEAEALATVLAKVGGDPEKSRRGLIDSIRDGLVKAGVVYDTDDIERPGSGGIQTGGIYFAVRADA